MQLNRFMVYTNKHIQGHQFEGNMAPNREPAKANMFRLEPGCCSDFILFQYSLVVAFFLVHIFYFSPKKSNECTKIQRRNGQNWFLRLLRGDSQLDCDAPVHHIAAVESDPGTWVTWRPILPSGYD